MNKTMFGITYISIISSIVYQQYLIKKEIIENIKELDIYNSNIHNLAKETYLIVSKNNNPSAK